MRRRLDSTAADLDDDFAAIDRLPDRERTDCIEATAAIYGMATAWPRPPVDGLTYHPFGGGFDAMSIYARCIEGGAL